MLLHAHDVRAFKSVVLWLLWLVTCSDIIVQFNLEWMNSTDQTLDLSPFIRKAWRVLRYKQITNSARWKMRHNLTLHWVKNVLTERNLKNHCLWLNVWTFWHDKSPVRNCKKSSVINLRNHPESLIPNHIHSDHDITAIYPRDQGIRMWWRKKIKKKVLMMWIRFFCWVETAKTPRRITKLITDVGEKRKLNNATIKEASAAGRDWTRHFSNRKLTLHLHRPLGQWHTTPKFPTFFIFELLVTMFTL